MVERKGAVVEGVRFVPSVRLPKSPRFRQAQPDGLRKSDVSFIFQNQLRLKIMYKNYISQLALKQERKNNFETFDSHVFFADTLFVLDVWRMGIGF